MTTSRAHRVWAVCLILLIAGSDLLWAGRTAFPVTGILQMVRTGNGYAFDLTFGGGEPSQNILGSAGGRTRSGINGSYRGSISYDTGNNFQTIRGRLRIRGKSILTPIGKLRSRRKITLGEFRNVREFRARGVFRVSIPE